MRKLFAALAVFGLAMGAAAHHLRVFVAKEGDEYRGYAYFSRGARAAECPVTVRDAAGAAVAELKTDAKGEFAFTPQKSGAYTFQVTTIDGHRAEYAAAEGPAAAPAAATTTMSPDSVAGTVREIAALRRQLDEYQAEIRLRDIVGGLGYILGLAGGWLWMSAKREKSRVERDNHNVS